MYYISELIKAPQVLCVSSGVEKANSYIIAVEGHAVLIDVCTKEIASILIDANLRCDYIILTHEHADHIWGLNAIRDIQPEMKVISHAECSLAICDPKKNKAKEYRVYAILRYGGQYSNEEAKNRNYQCEPADIVFQDEYYFTWRGLNIRIKWTPGHSRGSVMIVIDTVGVFSGDTILLELSTFLDFEGGNRAAYTQTTEPYIESLADNLLIFPGHGDTFLLKEWRCKMGE